MSLGIQQPFVDSRVFNKANAAYVLFPSQTDAMIASLQLFHDVPCRVMDLIFSVITHPEFVASHATLRSSMDVIDIVEESRMKDRMAIVHKRSLGHDGHTGQTGFPQFILDEVLDILHADRMAKIKYTFKDMYFKELVYDSSNIEEDRILKQMSLVHRSWTFPSQKALGRILFINRPAEEMSRVISPPRKSIFGPWSTIVAFHMYCCLDDRAEYDEYHFLDNFREEYRQWFENVHRILVSFTNLRRVWMQSYGSVFTEWANFTIRELVRRNTYLKDITLHAESDVKPFILDPLAEASEQLKHLKTLDIDGARFSDDNQGKLMEGTDFVNVTSLVIKRVFSSITSDLQTLRIISTLSKPFLESLHIIDDSNPESPDSDFEEIASQFFPPAQCALSFYQLRSLRIEGSCRADHWLEWIGPYCSSLKEITLDADINYVNNAISLIPVTIRSLNVRITHVRWSEVEEVTAWTNYILSIFSAGHFSELKSFSLCVLWFKFDEGGKLKVQNLPNQIREFEESMKYLCQNAGVEYFLDL